MADSNADPSPLERAAGAAGPRATEAFSVLANETRLSILLALWEAYEPFADGNAVTFSELRDRVGVADSGQFNYHLDKLAGHFIEKTDGGYELRRAGQKLVRSVIAGAGLEDPTLEPTDVGIECSFCGAPTVVTYADEWLYISCTECEGFYTSEPGPDGFLSGVEFNPAGFTDRDAKGMLQAAWTAGYALMRSSIEGVCEVCSGRTETVVDVCGDHDDEGVCDDCGRRVAALARMRCTVCKNHHQAPPRTAAIEHPAVIAFYYARGVPFQFERVDFATYRRRGDLIAEHTQTVLSTDPARVRVTVSYAGDTLELTFDGSLDVIAVVESSAPGSEGTTD